MTLKGPQLYPEGWGRRSKERHKVLCLYSNKSKLRCSTFKQKTTTWKVPGKFCFVVLLFLGPHPWHMEVSRLGVESQLEMSAYTTATATRDLSHICELHHSSWKRWILNPLSEAKDPTCVLMDASQILFLWATTGTPGKLTLVGLGQENWIASSSQSHQLSLPLFLNFALSLGWHEEAPQDPITGNILEKTSLILLSSRSGWGGEEKGRRCLFNT